MKDMIFIITIVIFWLLLGMTLTYIFQDATIRELEAFNPANQSFVLANTSQSYINVSTEDLTSDTSTKSFLDMTGRMLTFRIPSTVGIPEAIKSFLEILNFVLLLALGLLLYRQVRSGGG